MRVYSLVFAVLLIAVPAFGLELHEMQEIALSKREIIKRYMVDLEKSEKDVARARSGYLPSVDLGYQVNRLDEGSVVENKENSTASAAISWNLFNGFRDKYQIESAGLLTEVEELQLDSLKQDIQLNVALGYLDVYERKANLEVAGKNYETLEKIYQDGKNRLDVGLIDRNELLKFKVDLDNSDILVESAKAGLEKSINLLGREIGEKLTLDQLSFVEFKEVPATKQLEPLVTLMLDERNELIVFEKLTDASRMLERVEQSDYYPKVNLVGSYRKYDNDTGSQSSSGFALDDDELRAQLVFSINLYQGGYTRETVAKTRLETRGLRYDLEELTDSLTTELQNLHIDFEVSLRTVEVALVSIEQAEENLRITRLKYNEGLQRESDLLDAVANLSRAQYNYVSVLRTVFLNHFRIMRAIEAF
jgi:outer membrane protein TolC